MTHHYVLKFVAPSRARFFPYSSLIEGEYIPSEEFPEGGPAAIRDLETAPFLRIEDDEAETWQQTVPPAELRQVWPITQPLKIFTDPDSEFLFGVYILVHFRPRFY